MKLSQISTDKAMSVLCEITPFLANITGDKDLLDAIGEKIDAKGKSRIEIYNAGINKLSQLVPIVLLQHKDDVFGLLAVLNETTADKIGEQPFLDTLGQVRDVLTDKDLVDFFKLWGRQDKE